MALSSSAIPQADRLDLVVLAAEAVSQGATTDTEISAHLARFDPQHRPLGGDSRDGRYYRLAAELLGLVRNENNNAALTETGVRFLRTPTEQRQNELISLVFTSEAFQFLVPFFEIHPQGVYRDELVSFIASITAIAENTAKRRLSTILSWLRNLDILDESGGRFTLRTTRLPVLEFQNVAEPLLPQSSDLKTYQIVEDRIRESGEQLEVVIDMAKRERANRAHKHLVDLVATRIKKAGYVPRFNKYVDLATQVREKSYIFEMKSITDSNAETQVRTGFAQLYVYGYMQNLPNANLILVTEKPVSQFSQNFLETYAEVKLLWNGDNELHASPQTREELAFLWS